ncbi:5-formyltetrahydrofolate cyclo-ligase [Sarcoptes scabiei]|nr:5-formyltetrahydrofolate cyclo-ligase [Sarcoptes scabiei]
MITNNQEITSICSNPKQSETSMATKSDQSSSTTSSSSSTTSSSSTNGIKEQSNSKPRIDVAVVIDLVNNRLNNRITTLVDRICSNLRSNPIQS